MNIKTGAEIVKLHREYDQRINELKDAVANLQDHSYAASVLGEQLTKLKQELQSLEDTRFQALDPVIIVKSTLGGNRTLL